MRKRRSGKKHSNFILPFCVTLGLVLLTGFFALFSYLWVTRETEAEPVSSSFQLVREETAPVKEQVPAQEIVEESTKYGDILQDAAYMAEHNIYAKEAANEEYVTIAFAGDILFDANYSVMATLIQNGGSIQSGIDAEVIAQMQSADIMMLNNEFPYSDRGTPTPEKQFTFRAAPSTVSYLNDLGVDIVSLANNHAYDYGEEALVDTLQCLKGAGIPYVGAGMNIQEACAPVYYIINDMKIAFISATQIERLDNPDTKEATDVSPGVFRCWNGERLMQKVQEARAESDFVIVYVHWGTENQEETDWTQNKQAVELVEAGADLIIGDHPHILQRIEIINGVPVIYSLGNFWFNSKPLDTGMVKVTLTEEGLQSFQFIPCLQSNCRTVLLKGEEKERVLGEMRRMSGSVQIDTEGCLVLPPK
ncbi:MAG: CapA family protein [Ruminococcus sp.]|nr:CapA family protein [Ruminococcus sp.]